MNLAILYLLLFSSDQNVLERTFYMGFTPWPYASTLSAVEDELKYKMLNTQTFQ